jgi:PAS domain S-box-containing protein
MSAEQAAGWGWAEAIHPDDRKGLVKYWQSCLTSGVPVETEARLRRFDGAYRWFLFRASPLRDESGKIVKWYGTNIDIEDRKRGEEALRASELSWRQIVDNIPGLVATMGAMGEVEFLNRQTLEYFGKTNEKLKNWALIDAVHPDDLPCVIEARKKSIEAGHIYEVEHRCRRADGVYRWFEVRGLPVRNVEGTITAWYLLLTDIDDLKKAEEALQSNERNLSLIINTIPTHIYVLNTEGSVQYVNQAVMDYTGLSVEDVKQEDYRDRVIHPEDFKRVRAGRAASLKRGAPFSTEQRVLGNDGQYRWFLVHYKPLLDEQGRIVRWYVAAFDIEDRKRAERQIQKSESNLRQVIDAIPALAWCNLPDGPNEFLNKGWHEYTGLSHEESHGWGWQTAFHPDDLPPLMERWVKMLASGEPDEIEARLRRHDGVYRWFLIRCEPFRDESGKIMRWYGTSTDIDDRKRAEEKLRRSETFLAEGQRLSRTGSFSWPIETDEITWSEEVYRIFQFEQSTPVTLELIGSRVHPEDQAKLNDMIERVRKAVSDFEYEHRLLMPDTSVKYLHLIAHGIRDNEGRLEYIGAIQDVTESKVAEEALIRARMALAHMARVTMLSALTASIAHEINQPIAAVITSAGACLRWLNRDQPEVQRAREAAMRIEDDGKRASAIITHLKSFYKKDVSPQREMVSVNDLVGEMLVLLRSEADRHSVVMRTELPADLPSVSADRVLLQQVLMNLMLNGMEAMSERGGELKIGTRREGGEVMVSVSDTGVGIPADKMEHIFNAFVTTKAGGTGMGLAISSTIIESHGGRLWATVNSGRGATFHFTLPTEPEA